MRQALSRLYRRQTCHRRGPIAQLGGEAALLFRASRRRRNDCPLYVPCRRNPDSWRRLLAERQANL